MSSPGKEVFRRILPVLLFWAGAFYLAEFLARLAGVQHQIVWWDWMFDFIQA